MKTSVMEVHDMLSVLSVADVENRIEAVPGVESATVNFAARNVTVRFDETRLEIADIRASVRQAGFVEACGARAQIGCKPGHGSRGEGVVRCAAYAGFGA